MSDRHTDLTETIAHMPIPDDEHNADDLSVAVAKHIADDIADAQMLRPWRLRTAIIMGVVAGVFYIILLCVIGMFISNDGIIACAERSPHVAIVILLILAVVPTIITLQIARAVFGYKKADRAPYTPIQALVHLMKEMQG